MTDPQNDVPCRDCKRPTQHATEICDDCRTLANVVACFDEENPGLYSPALGVYHLPDHGGILTLFADRWVAESDPESDERPWESLSAFVEASDDYRKSRALRSERDTLAAEVKRLREPHDADDIGEIREAYPDERITLLVEEVERLRAHNARMVARLKQIAGEAETRAGALDDGGIDTDDLISFIERDDKDAPALRRLAAGEVDDG